MVQKAQKDGGRKRLGSMLVSHADVLRGMCCVLFSLPQGLSVASYSNLARDDYYPHFIDAEPETELFCDSWRS